MPPIYTAIFLDAASKETLLKAFPPAHPKVAGNHVTLVFKPGPETVKAFEPYLEKVSATRHSSSRTTKPSSWRPRPATTSASRRPSPPWRSTTAAPAATGYRKQLWRF